MKKTLIASAIAAATFSGAALAESNMPTVYGNIQLAVAYEDSEVKAGGVTVGDHGYEHMDNGSTLGIKHEHEIAPGLTGFFKAEFEFDADDKSSSSGLSSLDEAYIGVKGDFGKVWVGSDDTIYEDAININDYFEFYGVSDLGATGEGDMVQYLTPSFGGLTLGAAVQVNGDTDDKGKGDSNLPFILTAAYSMGDTTVAFGVDSNDGGAPGTNENAYGISVSQGLGDLNVSFAYETVKDAVDKASLLGVYSMGANNFALGYEFSDFDNGDEANRVLAQALHNLSDNMYVYVEGQWIDGEATIGGVDADLETTGVALGATYYF
ncbi:porin [Marinobacter zhejiangensis]|uniref:Outer membrane protein (Porin) n=1 Tax=Marinobacter zhejiangensis TaxID=488535 RepID=A0A1I4SDA2_9GAMM|nr:porin [Marinobacter zhejiangensis]SFM62468.1 Outer membrane protein (porin) [Marinobacter zhejiangensis]